MPKPQPVRGGSNEDGRRSGAHQMEQGVGVLICRSAEPIPVARCVDCREDERCLAKNLANCLLIEASSASRNRVRVSILKYNNSALVNKRVRGKTVPVQENHGRIFNIIDVERQKCLLSKQFRHIHFST